MLKEQLLNIVKTKRFIIILLIEIICIFAVVFNIFCFKSESVYYSLSDATVIFGSVSEDYTSCYADKTFQMNGDMLKFERLKLNRGVYYISLHYETDTNMLNLCYVTDDSLKAKDLLTNGESLYSGLNTTNYEMWLLEDTQNLSVSVSFCGEGSINVSGLTITESNAMNYIFAFIVVLFSLLFDVVYILIKYNRLYGINEKNKNTMFGMILLGFLASLPLMLNYMLFSADLIFHLQRIEGIKDCILNGQFPARIAPEWQQGYGYASSIFYGDTLLYIAAFFRMLGFSVLSSYCIFYFIITVLTLCSAYYCFTKIFSEQYIGLLCSMLYIFSVYRIYKTYVRGYMGETIAFIFLPFIIYGFYRVFSMDIHDKNYKSSWIILTIGFTGLIQSHLLTCEMVGGFTILICIIFIKKVIKKETFFCLAKTVIASTLLSAWFLVPFLDYMMNGNFVIQNVQARTIQEMGLQIPQLFSIFPRNGENMFFNDNGLVDSQPVGIGISLLIPLVLWLWIVFVKRSFVKEKKYYHLGNLSAFLSILALSMSLSVFPWNSIQSLNGFCAFLVSSLQYPNRFLSIATILLVLLAGVTGKCIIDCLDIKRFGLYFVLLASIVMLTSGNLIDSIFNTMDPVKVYNPEGMGTGYISGGEYNPYGSDPNLFMPFVPDTQGLVVEHFLKQGDKIEVCCVNDSGKKLDMKVPLLNYKGYIALTDTGELLPIKNGDNFELTVTIPADFDGYVYIMFRSPWYWRASEFITLLAFVMIVFYQLSNLLKIKRIKDKS